MKALNGSLVVEVAEVILEDYIKTHVEGVVARAMDPLQAVVLGLLFLDGKTPQGTVLGRPSCHTLEEEASA